MQGDPDPLVERPTFRSYEPVDHRADLALLARGRTLAELFRNAALGMLEYLHDPRSVRGESETRIEVEARDLEELLVAWLREILHLREVR